MNISIYIFLLIVAGILIYLYQEKKYFYLKTFYGKIANNSSLIIKFRADGRYILNQTDIPTHSNNNFIFQIEEGNYVKQNNRLELERKNRLKVIFKDAESMVKNKSKDIQEARMVKQSSKTFDLKPSSVHLNGEKLLVAKKAKIINIKQYKKIVNKDDLSHKK